MNAKIDWIAVDWGTSRLRTWAMTGATVVGARDSDRGMATLRSDEYELTLRKLIADWIPSDGRIEVLVCGMAGARSGWTEADYRAVPCPPLDAAQAVRPKVNDPHLSVRILPGLCQFVPPDVMRGEETQIAGFLRQNPDFDGVLCLPGTHSKWVRVKGGKVDNFQTFMTGEVFALLSQKSVLSKTIGEVEPDTRSFDAYSAPASQDPGRVWRDLFGLRAAALLEGVTGSQTLGRLSAMLIGAEIGAASSFWKHHPATIIAAPALADLYRRALETAGGKADCLDGGELALSGLIAAHEQLRTSS